MQKLDLRQNLETLIRILKSREIVAKVTSRQNFPGREMMDLLVDSKSGYDQASMVEANRSIFQEFGANEHYTTNNFSTLFAHATQFSSQQISGNNFLSFLPWNRFMSFHSSLITTFNLVDKLLIHNEELVDEKNSIDFNKAEERGNLTLQIIDDGNVSLHKLRTAIEAIEKLIETVYSMIEKIEDEKVEDKPEITLIDSGSDISFSIKLPKKATNIIAQILKEAWDLIVNNKSYRHKQKLSAIKDSLTQFKKIEEARSKGKIDDHTAEILKSGLTESTVRLIGTNTVNKKQLDSDTTVSNRKLLTEANKTFLLEQRNEDEQ